MNLIANGITFGELVNNFVKGAKRTSNFSTNSSISNEDRKIKEKNKGKKPSLLLQMTLDNWGKRTF